MKSETGSCVERTSEAPDWVDVTDEPNHKEIFRNEQIRVYVAVIPPGEETLYHRHDKDTLYLVLQGGKNASCTLPRSKSTKYVFPKSVDLKRKVTWGLTRLLFGWTYLPRSTYFFMHNSGNPVVHKVRASEDNPRAMELMGIEFLGPPGVDVSGSAGTDSLTADYEDDGLRVFRVGLPSDLRRVKGPVCFTGLVILMKGALRMEASSPDGPGCVRHDLEGGYFLWNDGKSRFAFATEGRTESELLLVAMK